jgi:hypothetical protein
MKFLLKKLRSYYLNKPILNLYNSNFTKKVLISYITHPYKNINKNHHSNNIESTIISNIFHQMGYVVDVFHYESKSKINFNEYVVIFGIGQLFNKAVQHKNINIKYIYYSTGAYFNFQNIAEIKRLKYLFNRTGKILKSKRFIHNQMYYATQFCDAILIIGNSWTLSTYYKSNVPKFKIPQSVFNVEWKSELKDRKIINNKNFLWFGGTGLVHKGLDLAIECFKDLKDFNLYIFGPKEEDFFELYKEDFLLSNIKYLGFVNINSIAFKETINKCNFSLFPSCSEGGSGSLLQTMKLGLIPIATIETGVDFRENGFCITDDINNMIDTVIKASKIDEKELLRMSKNNISFIENNHTITNFEIELNKSLKEIIIN